MEKIDKRKFAVQPDYHTKSEKINARVQFINAYRAITGLESIPEDKGYWTFCNKQPDTEGSEIVQLVRSGLIKKNQFYGVDCDIRGEGIIASNKKSHPEANWFDGKWLEVIDDHYDQFNPALIYFDYTRTVLTTACHMYLAKTMNMCPKGTVVVANLMLSDGHSKKRFDPNLPAERVGSFLRAPNEWNIWDKYYPYKSSRTEMATYIFYRTSNETTAS